MSNRDEFDLAEFLGDSLSLQSNIAAPARFQYSKTANPNDDFEKFILRDPYEILGEIDFKRRGDIPESEVGTPIQEFYRGANVFITGATGFIGKVLTEKLIRSIPHIGKIYLLIRAKRGLSPRERFDKLLEDKVFNRMKAEVPDYATRLTPVEGDLATPGLGLSPVDRHTLADHVNVVFHGAADVRFIEPLKVAVDSNVHGSRRVLDLAREMKNLRAYVHVSTAYSHCVRKFIDENIPKMNLNYKEVLDYTASKTEEEITEQTPRLLQGWPNTYSFSKAVCEEMIKEEASDLPICIFRPSIVVSTYQEPVRGWTDNLNGPMGFCVGVGNGILHTVYLNPDLRLDIVPVDFVANCMIAAAWRTADENNCVKCFPRVYNFCLRSMHPGKCWKWILDFFQIVIDNFPFTRSMWYPKAMYTENYYIYQLFWYLLHRAPGAVLDKLTELSGGKPILTNIYKKLEKMMIHLDYFIQQQWEFKSDNVLDLWHSLEEDDRRMFPFDVRDMDHREYYVVATLGVRYYFLKENLDTLPAARRRNNWLYWLHNSAKLACSVLVLKILAVTSHALPF